MPIDSTNIGDELTELLPAETTSIDHDHEREVVKRVILLMVPKNILISSLIVLPELKQAVICDKNNGCKLLEQRRSEYANELHLSS